MPPFTLCAASTPHDLDDVRALCWAYRDFLIANSAKDREITETFYPVPKYEALMAKLPDLHARPKGIILLARDLTGIAVGCGMIHALDPKTSEIKRVFVSERARGQGVARMICETLITQAKADGFARIVLDTSRSLTAAQHLYGKLGFAQRDAYQPIPKAVLPELLFYERILTP